ncbi:MAG: branched-chain amino acid ABC transporter permease [Armatimonadetes bacterium]|nr:branched-chain amino acid ABC transporter permease [Armatimonadota bacterium]
MAVDHLFAAGVNFGSLPAQVVNGILIGSLYALIALGYTMVYGVLRLINFAHGEVYMLGAYTALFVSWLIYGNQVAPVHTFWWALPTMLLASMTVSALVGVILERFAYRPLRNEPRIASLITAIGLSLLLQFGGQLFLPVAPPPNINAKVNPYSDSMTFYLKPPAKPLADKASSLEAEATATEKAYNEALSGVPSGEEPGPTVTALRNNYFEARNAYEEAKGAAANSGVSVTIPKGQLIMFVVTMFLMAILRHLVMFTKQGRAMRAVSHDFDSASLMGINVNSTVTFTFILGSALAGAGAMMSATFISGVKIDTFYGLLPGVKAFVAAVLGGIGNIPGAVLGGLLMGVAESLVIWVGWGDYKDAVAFLILIGVLMFRPGGLLGSAKVEKV